jgi:uncharacterized protein (DUF1778 family)
MDQKVTLNLKVTREQRHDLDMAATEQSWSMSQIIREAIAAKLQEIAPERARSWAEAEAA